MKALITTLAIFVAILTLPACNDHLAGDEGEGNNDVSTAVTVETLSPAKTALWVELSTGDYDFALTKERTSSDPDLVGHRVKLPSGLSAMVVTGEDELIVEADDLFEVWEVPADQIGQFEMLIRNLWMMPSGWQPNLFPKTEGEAADLEILLSAFICGMELDLYSRGCQGDVPSSLFRFVGETADYRWVNTGHAKYLFVIKN